MIAGAISIEYYRRSEARRKRIQAEWRSAFEILKERSLSDIEQELIEDVIRRNLPHAPLRALTVRHEFDKCVANEMARLDKAGDRDAFQTMGERLRDIRAQLGLDYLPLGQRITSTRELVSGQWFSIAHARNTSPQWTRMRVDRVDEAYVYVSSHPKKGEPSPIFHDGDAVRCRLWRDEDARYAFSTTVASYEDLPPQWRLDHANDLIRTQARDHFRVRHDQHTTVDILNASLDGDDSDIAKRRVVTKLRGRVTSLSAGGCALVIPQEVSRQVLLRIELEVDEEEPMLVGARIVSSSGISGDRVLVRAAFVNLDDAHRDRIAKYVLQRQQHLIAAREAAK